MADASPATKTRAARRLAQLNVPEPLRPSSRADSRNLHPVGGAPTGAPVVAVRDVAIVPTGTDQAPLEEYRDHPPVRNFDLGNEVTIERLSDAEYELMIAACRRRALTPQRQTKTNLPTSEVLSRIRP